MPNLSIMDLKREFEEPLNDFRGQYAVLFVVTGGVTGRQTDAVLMLARDAEELPVLKGDIAPPRQRTWRTLEHLLQLPFCATGLRTEAEDLDKREHVLEAAR